AFEILRLDPPSPKELKEAQAVGLTFPDHFLDMVFAQAAQVMSPEYVKPRGIAVLALMEGTMPGLDDLHAAYLRGTSTASLGYTAPAAGPSERTQRLSELLVKLRDIRMQLDTNFNLGSRALSAWRTEARRTLRGLEVDVNAR